jgi:hypothetical protein
LLLSPVIEVQPQLAAHPAADRAKTASLTTVGCCNCFRMLHVTRELSSKGELRQAEYCRARPGRDLRTR